MTTTYQKPRFPTTRTTAQILADLEASAVPDDGDPEFLTTAQLAEFFRISPRELRRWVEAGLIPVAFVTPAGHRRFRTSDMQAMRGRP